MHIKTQLLHLRQDFWWFFIKQANAAIFGSCLLAAIILTNYITVPGLTRFDFLFLAAITIQAILIIGRFEEGREVLVVAIFHILATVMELFKTAPEIGSWSYQGSGIFMLATVPLFAGFMYSAVGSYLARVWRIFNFSFTNYPPFHFTVLLAILSYINFISHHFIPDMRYLLVLFSAVLFWRTRIYYTPLKRVHSMPLLVGFLLVASVIFMAENFGTLTNVWLYPNQVGGWEPVPFSKFGSWYLLLIVSFVLVSTLHRKHLSKGK